MGKPHRKILKTFCPARASRLSKNPGHAASVYNKTAFFLLAFLHRHPIPLRPLHPPTHTYNHSSSEILNAIQSRQQTREPPKHLCAYQTQMQPGWGRGVVAPSESRFVKLQTRHFRRFIINSFLPSMQEFARILREPLLWGRGGDPSYEKLTI